MFLPSVLKDNTKSFQMTILQVFHHVLTFYCHVFLPKPLLGFTRGPFRLKDLKSVNIKYNMAERQVGGTIVLLSDGPMFILIDW